MDVLIKPLAWDDIITNVANGTVDIIYSGLADTPGRPPGSR